MFIFEKGEGKTLSPGNRSDILAPRFEVFSIPYCVISVFFRAK